MSDEDRSPARELWRLLDDVEDLYAGGFRTAHPSPVIRPAGRSANSPATVGSPSAGPRHDVAAGSTEPAIPGNRASGTASNRSERPAGASRAGGSLAAGGRAPASPEFPSGSGDPAARRARLADIERRIAACTRCRLHETRHNTVPGVGVFDPQTMVIGEGPGADEDAQGLPFVGRAGQYLDKWLDAIGLSRHKSAYIANIVKCRPPGNRDPQTDESDACNPYLLEQIEIIRPKTILAVGRIASQMLVGKLESLGAMRGRIYDFRGTPLVVTYHPSGVLRNPDLRRPVWEDLKRLRQIIDGGTPGEE